MRFQDISLKFNLSDIGRKFIMGACLLGMVYIQGTPNREAQLLVLIVLGMASISLLLRNVWISAFLVWTSFLFVFFKFSGNEYVTNIFMGCLFYLLTKIFFRKEHVDKFITFLMWFMCLNLGYIIVQGLHLDFIYSTTVRIGEYFDIRQNTTLNGFMGAKWGIGTFLALCMPLVATRQWKLAIPLSISLIIPMWYADSVLSIGCGIVGLMFVLWYRIPKKIWIGVLIVLISLGTYYGAKVNLPGKGRFEMWKNALSDASKHPLTGNGLDSFRKVAVTPEEYSDFKMALVKSNVIRKDHDNIIKINIKNKYQWVGKASNALYHVTNNLGHSLYAVGRVINNKIYITSWDNPHSLIVSLFYEWGILGIIIFLGLICCYVKRFRYAVKEPNTIGLAGFLLVLGIVSLGHFPMFIARIAIICVITAAMYEVQTNG